ncbi:methyl-accepting chemotaxis protein [Acidihalobacter yilgarnensis]|nr:methyl-accepting chemotaxis protein [Acidihalobacter yilgarnensis]
MSSQKQYGKSGFWAWMGTIQGRLYLMGIAFVLLLIATTVFSLWDADHRLMTEREGQVQREVQTAASLVQGFVKRAEAGKLTEAQAKAAAMEAVASLRYGKYGYFWINDMQPRMVMHPFKPALDGRDLSDFKDAHGKPIYDDIVNLVQRQGSGYIWYVWPLPGQTEPVDKVAYVAAVPAWGWVIGSGLYMVDLERAFHAQMLQYGLVAIVALVIGLLLVTWLGRSVTRPLGMVTQRLGEIAKGEGDLTQRLDENRGDEVGTLAVAFNRFVDRIQHLIKQVSGSTSQLAAAAEELSATSEETSRHVRRQQSETDQVAAAMNQMSATVMEVAKHANEAAQAARIADGEAQQGRQVVGKAVSAIDALAAEVEQAAQVIQGVEGDSAQIGQVLAVISGISEQTNLLALNAAIEAARAGEQGRGFAVVADEVRTLAKRTQDSTEEIRAMIERLQGGTKNAVRVMEAGRDRARASVEQARAADESLGAITRSVARINDMNALIASAAEEQSSVSDEIDRNISNISQATQQTATGSQQTAVASEELARLAAQLQSLVGQFRV